MKDNKHREIVFSTDKVTQIVGYDKITGIPYFSVSVKENGEAMSLWVDNEFRNTHGLLEGFIVYLSGELEKGTVKPNEGGYFYFLVHPNNKEANSFLSRLGSINVSRRVKGGIEYNFYMLDANALKRMAKNVEKTCVPT
jgi:hypothetical protein